MCLVRQLDTAGEWVAAADVPILFSLLPQHMEVYLSHLTYFLAMISMTSCPFVCEESLWRISGDNVALLRRHTPQ